MKLYSPADNYKTKGILITAKYVDLDVTVPEGGKDGKARGKVPVLETAQGCVFSSTAIARYIARIRRDTGLYGQNLLESGQVDSWIEFCAHEIEVPLCCWTFPVMGIMEEVPQATKQAKEDVTRALRVLDNHLLHQTFMVGNQITLADIKVCCALVDGFQHVIDAGMRKSYGNLMRWFDVCVAQPEFAAVLGKVQMCTKVGASAAQEGGKKSPKQEAKAAPKEAAPKSPKQQAKEAGNAAPAKEGKKDSGSKKDNGSKKDSGSKKKETEAEKVPTPEELAAAKKALLKKVIKAGGKRGVEIEGAADMGGLGYFCTSVDEPNGELEMCDHYMTAMNEKSDPTEEERKGGSGEIGKMIFSAGTDQLAILAYVPESKKKDLNATEWITQVVALFQGEVCPGGTGTYAKGFVTADTNVNKFPLKMKEPSITEAITFLKKKGLFPDKDDDSDDDYVFGDDDFPS